MIDQTVVTNPDLNSQIAGLTASLTQISAFLSHVSVGGATSQALEWAKGKPGINRWWSLLSGRGKAIVGGVLAGLGSLGISAVFSHDPQHEGVYILAISGLTAQSIGAHLWSFAQSWVFQQGWYMSLIKPRPVSGVEQKVGSQPAAPVVVEPAGGN